MYLPDPWLPSFQLPAVNNAGFNGGSKSPCRINATRPMSYLLLIAIRPANFTGGNGKWSELPCWNWDGQEFRCGVGMDYWGSNLPTSFVHFRGLMGHLSSTLHTPNCKAPFFSFLSFFLFLLSKLFSVTRLRLKSFSIFFLLRPFHDPYDFMCLLRVSHRLRSSSWNGHSYKSFEIKYNNVRPRICLIDFKICQVTFFSV